MTNITTIIHDTLAAGEGILRLAPNWVPRQIWVPGRRIKLHPDDYYILGGARGGIDERWLASSTPAHNGPLTARNEGISHVVAENGALVPLTEAVDILGADLLGARIWGQYGRWPAYSKFFDNLGPLPHHIHHSEEHAQLVGMHSKPECYYFPVQCNDHGGRFPYTFFGIEPGTTKEQVKACLMNFNKGDNNITNLSRAYRLELGTGWDVPPGLLHAPGSLCTYEPQAASDVYAMYQSLVDNAVIPEENLWHNSPEEKHGDYDYLIELLDWEMNVDPNFVQNRFMRPIAVQSEAEAAELGYCSKWICYKSPAVSATELTVAPGRSVVVKDAAAYGFIMMQGHGTINGLPIETPVLIRYGQLTNDEYFVSEAAAVRGVEIVNQSSTEPIVMLKHYGPGNPDMEFVKS